MRAIRPGRFTVRQISLVIAAPTNYDSKKNYFDTSAVESVIELVEAANAGTEHMPWMVIKSTIPVGYTKSVREKIP